MLLLLAAAAGAGLLLTRNKPAEVTPAKVLTEEEETQQQMQRVREAVDSMYNEKAKTYAKIAADVQSPDMLQTYTSEEQAGAGFVIIEQSIAAGDLAKASQYISLLMRRNDSHGLNAAKYCYKIAADDRARKACKDRAEENARSQGIIGPKESLPVDYMIQKDGEG